MHMNNVSRKSDFICKNYLNIVVCMKSINSELELLYRALHIANEI